MAIYHLSVRHGKRRSGQSAAAKAEYLLRLGRYSRGRLTDEELLHSESGNMPSWSAADHRAYWESADLYEAKNGKLFVEVVAALPCELDLDQQIELVRDFVSQATQVSDLSDGARLPYTLAIHRGGEDGGNPHLHLMLSERAFDGHHRDPRQWFRRAASKKYGKRPEEGGARKTRELQPKTWLLNTRALWAEVTNRHLSMAGVNARIDHRTLEAQGIDRVPGVHLGYAAAAMEERGVRTERGDLNRIAKRASAEVSELAREKQLIDEEIERVRTERRRTANRIVAGNLKRAGGSFRNARWHARAAGAAIQRAEQRAGGVPYVEGRADEGSASRAGRGSGTEHIDEHFQDTLGGAGADHHRRMEERLAERGVPSLTGAGDQKGAGGDPARALGSAVERVVRDALRELDERLLEARMAEELGVGVHELEDVEPDPDSPGEEIWDDPAPP